MIRICDVADAVFCPRLVYLTRFLGFEAPLTEQRLRGLIAHAVRREFSMRQIRLISTMQCGGDVEAILRRELDLVTKDTPSILSDVWLPEYHVYLTEAASEVSSELDRLVCELSAMVEDMGFEAALEYVTPWGVDYKLSSESLNLSGRVDRIMRRETYIPVEVNTGQPPEHTWDSDRVQVCAYGMLLEEHLGCNIPYGLVEYTRIQEQRPVHLTSMLRNQVISARDVVAEILDGKTPPVCPHGNPKRCFGCSLNEQCYSV